MVPMREQRHNTTSHHNSHTGTEAYESEPSQLAFHSILTGWSWWGRGGARGGRPRGVVAGVEGAVVSLLSAWRKSCCWSQMVCCRLAALVYMVCAGRKVT
ncbi:hypothetical protein E2C01_018452 [Portunus trituberculatus]|uniref:Uncharacterized protein n=1 Tax=Portunus trituberculatus TaxID=210409 RepID=A0A5B7DVN1_PORTR|nr:hypothetical protein [Portunus trituberculatus]